MSCNRFKTDGKKEQTNNERLSLPKHSHLNQLTTHQCQPVTNNKLVENSYFPLSHLLS